jgi:hypothetical protein
VKAQNNLNDNILVALDWGGQRCHGIGLHLIWHISWTYALLVWWLVWVILCQEICSPSFTVSFIYLNLVGVLVSYFFVWLWNTDGWKHANVQCMTWLCMYSWAFIMPPIIKCRGALCHGLCIGGVGVRKHSVNYRTNSWVDWSKFSVAYWRWLQKGSFRWSAPPLIQDGGYGRHLGFWFPSITGQTPGSVNPIFMWLIGGD